MTSESKGRAILARLSLVGIWLGMALLALMAGLVVLQVGARNFADLGLPWADELARMAGVAQLGLRPLRRTALLVAPPAGVVPDAWPMVVDVDEDFYLKPDAGKLLLSPADETPAPPSDAQPDEMDVAICVDRIQGAFDLEVRRIEHKWAGLRSFLPDKMPAVGYDACLLYTSPSPRD